MSVNLSQHVYEYCERLGPDLFAEPLNALSNFAFFYFAWRLWAARGEEPRLSPALGWLAALIALVGAGSLSFHTLATYWAAILDVVFIAVFNVSYLVLFLRHAGGWPWGRSLSAGAAFVVFDRGMAAVLPGGALNGSLLYLPAVIVLLALVAYAWRRCVPAGRMMAGAAVVFGVSLLARTVDRGLCSEWPWGTHFLWHLLNAWVLFRLSRALIVAARPATAVP
jgi:Ceramidase